MTREIFTHTVNPINDQLRVAVYDKPGAGGASHEYGIELPSGKIVTISFQNGTIPENGVNGVTIEALLAIVADRLECFQNGPFPCTENMDALSFIREAMKVLHSRTMSRMARGVEGKMEV